MSDLRHDVEGYLANLDAQSVLREFGELVHPVILGEPEGYVVKAKEALRRALCPSVCDFLSNERLTNVIDVAMAVGDTLIKVMAKSEPTVPATLIWQVAAVSARTGLPSLLKCAGCPLEAKSD